MDKEIKKSFEFGIKYEKLRKEKDEKIILGWTLVIGSFIWYFFSVWNFNERFYGGLFMFFIGIISLYVGYQAKKEIKLMDKTLKKNA